MPVTILSSYTSERRGIPATRRRRTNFSWVIGGYEWRRHLHFQPSVKQYNRFYDQARGRILSKKHNNSCLVDHQKKSSDFSVFHHQKKSSESSVFDHQKKYSDFSVVDHEKKYSNFSVFHHQKKSSDFSVFDHQKKYSDFSVVDHQKKCSDFSVSDHQPKASAEAKEKSEGVGFGVRKLWQGWRVPLWRKLLRKLKAKAKKIRPVRSEVLNYDVSSYEKNFDDSKWYSNPSFEASNCLRRSHSVHVKSSSTRSCDQLQRQSSAPLCNRFCDRQSQQQLDRTVVG